MDELENEKSEDTKGKSSGSTKADNNNEQPDSNTSNDVPISSSQNSSSLISTLISLWKRLPIFLKGIITTSTGYILLILSIIILIILFASAATGVAEDLWEGITNIGTSVSEIGEKVGNFFTGEGFVTNQEKAEKYEKKYYEKLKEVSDYYRKKYNVQIDTTLITATLFYGKGMSDYIDNEDINDIEDIEDSLDEDIYQGEAEFYKLARRQIKTLAKFQIVEETAYNACYDGDSESKITPLSAKEIADTWTGMYGWNQQATFNNQPYEVKSYVDADGETQNIKWCEFHDAEEKLRPFYEHDKDIYEKRKAEFDSCMESRVEALNSCIETCPSEACVFACRSTYGGTCSSQKEKLDKAYEGYYNRWLSEGLFNEDGGFSCVKSQWGAVASRKDTDFVYSHVVNPEWINRDVLPSRGEVINSPFVACSEKNAIVTQYVASTEREGVYYYKLLSRNVQFLSNKNFIEKYYPDYISDDPDKAMEDSIEIVEGIFDLYEFIAERDTVYCYTPSTSTGSYSSPDRAEFISMIADEIVQNMQNSGVLASLTIAQAAVESGNGTSGLSRPPYNNYYGMTAGSCASKMDTSLKGVIAPNTNGNNCNGNAFWDGSVVRMCRKDGSDCQWYRVYDSFSNSTNDHSRLLGSKMYSCAGITDPLEAVNCVQKTGYASNPNYVRDIMGVINTYNLTQYDIGEWNGEVLNDYGSASLGTVCYGNTSTGISNGEGTISGQGAQGIRTHLWGTTDYRTFWGSNNNIFYSSGFAKECTWYAHGRGLEILTKNGMSLETAQKYMNPMHGNAGKWYGQNQYFSSSTDYSQPKVGAIIVWSKGTKPGHVAIIEDIKYDTSGNIISITTTEGGQSINGFKYTEGRTLDWIKAHGSYRFVGYVYLLD